MTEERTEYTVDGLQIENDLLRERLEALRKTVDGFSDASTFQWSAYQRRIAELEVEVARLEADNRRLHKLDSIPLDALRRLVEYCEWSQSEEYPVNQHIADYNDSIAWFRTLDGDA